MAGGTYDRGTGWIKYGQRWYNPTTGHFTQQDTIERFNDPREGNRYAYAADNPSNYTDPTGKGLLANIVGYVAGVALEVICVSTVMVATGGILGGPAAYLCTVGAAVFGSWVGNVAQENGY